MKRFFVCVIVILAFCAVSYGRPSVEDVVWKIKVGTKEYATDQDFILIDINGKTVLKVWRCGKVEEQEYKQVVPNKDRGGPLIWNDSGDSVILTVPGTTLENRWAR